MRDGQNLSLLARTNNQGNKQLETVVTTEM